MGLSSFWSFLYFDDMESSRWMLCNGFVMLIWKEIAVNYTTLDDQHTLDRLDEWASVFLYCIRIPKASTSHQTWPKNKENPWDVMLQSSNLIETKLSLCYYMKMDTAKSFWDDFSCIYSWPIFIARTRNFSTTHLAVTIYFRRKLLCIYIYSFHIRFTWCKSFDINEEKKNMGFVFERLLQNVFVAVFIYIVLKTTI